MGARKSMRGSRKSKVQKNNTSNVIMEANWCDDRQLSASISSRLTLFLVGLQNFPAIRPPDCLLMPNALIRVHANALIRVHARRR